MKLSSIQFTSVQVQSVQCTSVMVLKVYQSFTTAAPKFTTQELISPVPRLLRLLPTQDPVRRCISGFPELQSKTINVVPVINENSDCLSSLC